jgi:PPOX class probable F420-dependent enzyme
MTMPREEIEAFLAEPRNVIVAAIRKDGRPQMTPNWFLWDGGRFYVSTTKTRRKYSNLKRDPRVQLCIDDPRGYKTVLVDGTTTILEDVDEQLPLFRMLLEKHKQKDPGDEALRKRLEDEQRVMLLITPDKPPEQWTAWSM